MCWFKLSIWDEKNVTFTTRVKARNLIRTTKCGKVTLNYISEISSGIGILGTNDPIDEKVGKKINSEKFT